MHIARRIAFSSPSLVACLLAATSASAATLFVDGQLGADCPGSYDPATRACSAGVETAFASIGAAAQAVQAGDTVVLREGSYGEQLAPTASGTATEPITFVAQAGETVTLEGIGEPAIYLIGNAYVTVQGLHASDVLGWGRLEDTSHVQVRDCLFTQANATGTTGGLKLVRASHTILANNSFDDGNDNVVVQESDRNLIVDNSFHRGRHSLLSIRCSDFTVVRGNIFDNPDQKSAEIYDCEGVSDAPFELDATKHNLFELNRFAYTLGSDQAHDYNGIQYAGQLGIVRRNLFYDNQGGGLGVQVYADEALYNYGHRIYNNTFVDNRCFGLIASNDVDPTQYFDVLVQNNLFFGNADCTGGGEQTSIGNPTAVTLTSNELATGDPGFEDVAARDLRLRDDSPMIDAAGFVTQAVGSGSGTQLVVADASYFYDGYGLAGEEGDLVQIEGQADTARVVAIDYVSQQLTLDGSLSWQDGDGVHLAYQGVAPDMGALELGQDLGPGGGGAGGSSSGTGGSSSGIGGSGGSSSSGSAGPGNDDGCGCRLAPSDPSAGWLGALLPLAALAGRRRRRR